MLKHCLSPKTFIPTFVAFFVSLGIVISCIRKMSFSVTSAKQEFTPAIVSLSTSWEMDIQVVHALVRVSEPIKLLEIPTSLILLMPNTSYAMLSLGIPKNMPRVTCIFRIHTHLRQVCINMFCGIPRESIA